MRPRLNLFGVAAGLLLGAASALAANSVNVTINCPDGSTIVLTYDDDTDDMTVSVTDANGNPDTTTGGTTHNGSGDKVTAYGTTKNGARWGAQVDDDASPRDDDVDYYCVGKFDHRPRLDANGDLAAFVSPTSPFMAQVGGTATTTLTVKAAVEYAGLIAEELRTSNYTIRSQDSSATFGSWAPTSSSVGSPDPVEGWPGYVYIDVELDFAGLSGVPVGVPLSVSTAIELEDLDLVEESGYHLGRAGDVTGD